jgi:hypothetical protein
MLTAALYCFGIAAFLVAASVCLSVGRLLKLNHLANLDKNPAWDGKTKWEDMKAAFLVYYVRCQERESENRQRILSWARTLLFCAGLCLIGVCFQVEFNENASIPQIVAHVKCPRATAALSELPQGAPDRMEQHDNDPQQ